MQKNFITLSNPAIPLKDQSTWIDELIKCTLTALNKHKDIIVVLERNDPLKNLIHAADLFMSELKKDVFEIFLLEKQAAGNDYMIWINQQGKIVPINSCWKTQLDEDWISQDAEHMHVWKQQALYFSSKTDALALKINPVSRSFHVVSQGRIVEGMTADAVTTYLKKQLLQGSRKEKVAIVQPQASQKSA